MGRTSWYSPPGKCSSRQGTAAENRGHGYGLRWAGAGVQLHGQRCEPRPGESGSPPLGNSRGEAVVPVRIFMAFPKADKLEHVIQKATELGATEIIAFPTARCVSRPEERALEKKAGQVAENCGFGGGAVRPGTDSPGHGAAQPPPPWRRRPRRSCPSCFMKMKRGTPFLCPWDRNRVFASVSLVTGPEGGLEPEEVAQARQAGLKFAVWAAESCDAKPPLCALWLR